MARKHLTVRERLLQWNRRHLAGLEDLIIILMPWALLMLLLLLIAHEGELIFNLIARIGLHLETFLAMHEFSIHFAEQLLLLEHILIGLFVLDLYFKFSKSHSLYMFFRHYAIDILAILPFGLIIRGFALVAGVQESVRDAQEITHIVRASQEERVLKLIGEGRLEAVERTTARIARLLRLDFAQEVPVVQREERRIGKTIRKEESTIKRAIITEEQSIKRKINQEWRHLKRQRLKTHST